MIKKNMRILAITTVVILMPMLAGIILWDKLPEQVPVHWDASWQPDNWVSKPMAVVGMPLVLAAIQWFAVIFTSMDPKNRNHTRKVLNIVFWITPAVSILGNASIYAQALNKDVNMETLVPIFLGLMFVYIGNYLPKCKQNYTIGIKTPWALDDEENWNKTHRLAGRLWVMGGFCVIITSFLGSVFSVLAVALIMCIIPYAYSYMLYRKKH